MKKTFVVVLLLFAVSACIQTDSNWVKKIDDNNLTVSAQHTPHWNHVTVTNNGMTWNGTLKGGEEKVADRKKLMAKLAEEEIRRICGGKGYNINAEPNYSMVDRNYSVGHTFGAFGSLLASAAEHAFSEYENLPTSGTFRYDCDKKEGGQ